MRILVHDYSGHPFQAQLSRELSRRGHEVVHSFCEAHVSGKGRLRAEPGETLRFEPIARGRRLDKMRFRKRLFLELGFGLELLRQVRRLKPDVVLVGNAPVPMLSLFAAGMLLLRRTWVHWQQDAQAVAVRSFAGQKLSPLFRVVATGIEVGERWSCRQAAANIVISEGFRPVHREWGTEAGVTVIPNWAPLDEIVPLARHNDWSREHGLDDLPTLVYSGTLGLKHDPVLLVLTARAVRDLGVPVHLVVVTEGPAVEVLREKAAELDVPVTLLPFQPYDRLPEVLATGDVLVVVLDRTASSFSVPSKTLSYLCAGRPVLGLLPDDNPAAVLLDKAGGKVLPPERTSVTLAAEWVAEMLGDGSRAADLGAAAREVAESEFALDSCADAFERVLRQAVSR